MNVESCIPIIDIIHNIVLDRYMYCQIVRVKGCMNDLNTASITGQFHFKLYLATNVYFICNTLLNQSLNQTVSQRVFILVYIKIKSYMTTSYP